MIEWWSEERWSAFKDKNYIYGRYEGFFKRAFCTIYALVYSCHLVFSSQISFPCFLSVSYRLPTCLLPCHLVLHLIDKGKYMDVSSYYRVLVLSGGEEDKNQRKSPEISLPCPLFCSFVLFLCSVWDIVTLFPARL